MYKTRVGGWGVIYEFADILQNSGFRGIHLLPDFFLCMRMTLHLYLTQSSVCRDNSIAEFCANFKLKVNKIKIKVLIFKNGGVLSRVDKWFYKDTPIDEVNSFIYVGLLFTTRLSFNQMVNELCVKRKHIFTAKLSSLHTYIDWLQSLKQLF